MSTQKKQFTQVELEMVVDQFKIGVPALLLLNAEHALIFWSKFEELKKVGFTEAQAMELVKARPLIEG